MIRLTWAAVIVSVLSALVFCGQLYEMITGGTATDKLVDYAKVQANASSDQGDAAQQFSDTTEDINSRLSEAVDQLQAANRQTKAGLNASAEATRLDQRAWFGISDFETLQFDPDDSTKPFRMQIVFHNSGKTPARQINQLGMLRFYASEFSGPTDTDWKEFLGDFTKSKERYVAAPNAARKAIFDSSMDKPTNDYLLRNYAAIKGGTLVLYYFGQATYIDVNDRPHTTRFCLFLAQPERKQLAYCGKGNEMD
jgi:uncharacterized protein YukE